MPLAVFPDLVSYSVREDNDLLVRILPIPARFEYNGTTIVCQALFVDQQPELTPPALLIILIGMLLNIYLYTQHKLNGAFFIIMVYVIVRL